MSGINVRALVFRAIALLVVVNATAGIIVIVSGSGQVGSTEAHVLETTGLLSLAVLLLLPCVLAHETKRFRTLTFLPALAAACIFAGFGLAVYLVWEDPIGDTPAKLAWSFGIAGGGLAHVCLLSLLTLRPGHEWVRLLAVGFTLCLAALLINAFWTIPVEGGFDDWKVRLFAVIAILAAATSLLAALVERIAGGGAARVLEPRRAAYCPNCGAGLPDGALQCGRCGARFRVEFMDA